MAKTTLNYDKSDNFDIQKCLQRGQVSVTIWSGTPFSRESRLISCLYHIVVLILHSFKIEGLRKINFTTPSIPRDFENGFLLVFRVISSQFSKCVSPDLTECGRC